MSEPIRTLIADDEPLARRQLRSLLGRDPEILVLAEAGSGREARKAISELKPELVLLDVRMPLGDGFSVLDDLPDPPYVIFATAHAEFALRAFDVDAVDYLLKPFDDERFDIALRRAKDAVRSRRLLRLAHNIARREGMLPTRTPRPDQPETLKANDGRDAISLNFSDIQWIEAADYYAQVHAHGKSHLVRKTLQSLEQRLGERFLRVHRSALVNTTHVDRLVHLENGELAVLLKCGTRVDVSRARRAHVLRRLKPSGD